MSQNEIMEQQVREALRDVVDPEIGMDVVQLGLIREVDFQDDETEVKMLLTTPFCPYAGSMIQQVKERTESVVSTPAKVTVLDEMWDPSMMEGGDWGLW